MLATPDPSSTLEQLLDRLLSESPRGRTKLLADLCAQHPHQADALRQRIQALDRCGVLEHDRPDMPSRIGSFVITDVLGTGGMGVVYRASQPNLDREVAIKLLRSEFDSQTNNRERFLREGRVVARLEHPAIVPILTFGEHQTQPYFVMRHVAGRSLAEVLESLQVASPSERNGQAIVKALREGPDGVDEVAVSSALHGLDTSWSRVVARLLLPIAEALGHAHSHGVVHRDVKPSNILIGRDGRAFLCDFGLATLDQDAQLTKNGTLLGSVPYMSPEQVNCQQANQQSDVFSFGSVLYEALLGNRPFGNSCSSDTMHAISRMEPRLLTGRQTDIEDDLIAIVTRCLEKRTDARYANGTDLANDLRAFLSNMPVKANRVTWLNRTVRYAHREPVRFALAASSGILLLLIASLSGYLWAQRDTYAAGHDKLRADRLERELAIGFHAMIFQDKSTAEEHFSKCLQIDEASHAAQTGLAILHGNSSIDAKEATTPTQLFDAATRSMFAGTRGDSSKAKIAVRLLTDAIMRTPRARPVYHGMLAMAAAKAGNQELALRTADALERLWPTSATAAYWSGYARISQDANAAELAFKLAVELDPTFAAAWAELGTAQLLQAKNLRAQKALLQATSLDSSNAKAWVNLGIAYKNVGNRTLAETSLRHAMGLKRTIPGASYNLGVLLQDDDPQAAITAFEATTSIAPDYCEAWYNLGALYTQEGNLKAGQQALLQAVHYRKSWVDAYRQLGTNRAAAGDAIGAAAAYQQVVTLAPNDGKAKRYLSLLQQHIDASQRQNTGNHLRQPATHHAQR